jgi:hypothetical protein
VPDRLDDTGSLEHLGCGAVDAGERERDAGVGEAGCEQQEGFRGRDVQIRGQLEVDDDGACRGLPLGGGRVDVFCADSALAKKSSASGRTTSAVG